MQGTYVIVRAYGNKLRVCQVWDIDEDAVFVCSPDNFARLSAGLTGLWPVAVPREDVFPYDPAVLQLFPERAIAPEEFWASLTPWVPPPIDLTAISPEQRQELLAATTQERLPMPDSGDSWLDLRPRLEQRRMVVRDSSPTIKEPLE